MICVRCGTAHTAGRFCSECGAALLTEPTPLGVTAAESSPRSASPRSYTPGHLVDRILNSRSALEGERKLVSVLFCDIANSTPLAERLGADRMHRVLNAFFDIALAQVHRFEGTVNQFLGDGFMALFGAPITHEDHARRAVLSALAVRDEVIARRSNEQGLPAGLQIRVGLNTGFVVVGKIGDNLRMDYTAIGDTTNVAARLQGKAEPDTVVISEAVHRHVHHHFALNALGARLLKGKSEPILLYEVLRERSGKRLERADRETPLFGRQAELAMIEASIERLLLGDGGILTITGEAGYGKSRLLAAARRIASEREFKWLEGGCLSFGKSLSYWPFRDVLRGCFEIEGDASETEVVARLEQGLQPLLGAESGDVLPYIASVLGIALSGANSARINALDALAVGHQIFRSTLRLFERLATARPLAVVLEDWHWADTSSAELLEHLISLAAKVPLLFVIASRPEMQGATASLQQALMSETLKPLHQSLMLSPLPDAAARLIIANVLGDGALPSHIQERLLQRAQGNPFYLGELVRALIATRAIEREPESRNWQGTEHFQLMDLPETVEGVILARIDRLDEDAKHLLKAAAVVGRTFFYRLLRAIAEGQASLDADIARLKAADLIDYRREHPEVELMFKHPLIQQAAYSSLLDDRRRHLHKRVAECIRTIFPDRLEEFYSVLAHHYAQAEDWNRAYEYLFKAGDQAGRIAADSEALEHYERALMASKTSAQRLEPIKRAELDERIGEALFRLGRHDAAFEHLRSAMSYLGHSYPTSKRGVVIAIAIKLCRRSIRAIKRIFVALPSGSQLPLDPPFASASHILETIASIDYFRNRVRFVLCTLSLLELAEGRLPSRALVVGTSALGQICDSLGLHRFASNYHAKAARLAEASNDGLTLGYCYLAKGLHEFGLGNWIAALETLSTASERFLAAGHLHHLVTAKLCRNFVLRSMGNPLWMDEVDDLVEISASTQDEQTIGWAKAAMGAREMHLGNHAAAARYYEEASTIGEALSDFQVVALCLARLALCETELGNVSQGYLHLERAMSYLSKHHILGMFEARVLVPAAEAYLCGADRTKDIALRQQGLRLAKEACARLTRLARQVGDESSAEALRLNGIRAWLVGDKRMAQRLWEQGIQVAERMHANYVLARLHEELGRRLPDAVHARTAQLLLAKAGGVMRCQPQPDFVNYCATEAG
jgi:class 3 adenylate cyclase/tetratricopeptide (TPR) repeat protein